MSYPFGDDSMWFQKFKIRFIVFIESRKLPLNEIFFFSSHYVSLGHVVPYIYFSIEFCIVHNLFSTKIHAFTTIKSSPSVLPDWWVNLSLLLFCYWTSCIRAAGLVPIGSRFKVLVWERWRIAETSGYLKTIIKLLW